MSRMECIFYKLLEYLIQNDGSVVCKWCGEVLPSRTRWYRHKYKLHVSTQVTQPAPLFKCHSCNAYFKSRKGYIGHLSSRHSDNENDENREEPVNKKTRRTSDVSFTRSKKCQIPLSFLLFPFILCFDLSTYILIIIVFKFSADGKRAGLGTATRKGRKACRRYN